MESTKQILELLKIYKLLNLKKPEQSWPNEIIRTVLFLNRNIFEITCSVKAMRESCNIPQNNFSSRFKGYIGKVPSLYIVHHRIEAAKLILQKSDSLNVTIGDISWFVGYEKPASFTTIFTNREGLSPMAWKKLKK
ncbi:helix-turn-helix domain-containing protein [Gracilimonas amylolytica]|uniref:helix-turn-helix domain-containing protein n=1 Tax=Gracilimonas amylolytica TaxID=1749045 RepID=UPI000CD96E12|nr:AraC family transcriptional regulator [Gracilimonas amylolytica]